jgi:colanic acid/amylovoran biosynthesis protein
MKILIINQHTSNHGDEAAGKALMSKLSKLKTIKTINILYNAINLTKEEYLNIENYEVIHNETGMLTNLERIIIIMTFIFPFFIMKNIFNISSRLKKEMELINASDKIINAPGGVNIGPYRRWRYLWRLFVAIKLKKDVAIYSISFGPIPNNYLFKKTSTYVLENVKFLSLRDTKSHVFAEEMNLNYFKSIDTAFLDEIENNKLDDKLEFLSNLEYIVFVPNQLFKWHPYFKKIDPAQLNNFYVNIMNLFISKDINIVLLPQLFGFGNDTKYFDELSLKVSDKTMIHIIDNSYDSEVQQKIIEKSEFVIGARYHSIIFAINNGVPFYSLSYEHKMLNTLETLNLEKYCVELLKFTSGSKKESDILEELLNFYNERKQNKLKIENAKVNAKKIASETFFECRKNFLEK